ncbi:MAG: LCP family protein [Lachnospiraceae bacterium]|nr:LCP family protein [Lachnospiraceae bacterium]
MSSYDFEDEYEDELDRMRAQRKRKKQPSAVSSPIDDDFQIEYLEEDDNLKPKSGHASNGGQGNGRRQDRRQAPPARRKPRRKKRRGVKLFLLAVAAVVIVLYGKRWMKDRDGYWNIAVFGVDSRDSNLGKGALADVQMLASINKKTGEIRLVSVFRDTYVQINDDGDFHKINEAYFKGGYQQALDTLKRNLDITVDDYATFNWKAVADAINILGGIDLEITDKEFAYINSFITETVESTGIYSQHLQSAGMNHLDGVQAVAYCRLRLMDTDFNRTERQRKVVSLALEKAKQADFNTLKTIAGTVIPEISTSIGIEDVIPLARNVNRYHLGQTAGFPFAKTTAMVGKMDCVIPMTLESNVVLLHQFLFDTENYQPSASVKTISGKISEKTGIYEEGKAAGADQNLTGSSSSSGNGSSSSTGGGSNVSAGSKEQQSMQATESEELLESASESVPESATESSDNENPSENDDGASTKADDQEEASSQPAIVEPLAPEETTLSNEQIQEGPGAANPPSDSPNVIHTKPAEPSTEGYGPGFENQ